MRPSELGNFRKIATSKVKQTNNYNKKGERYEQYYISKAMLCSLIKYGISKGEFRQVNINAVVDLLLFSYQGVRMLSSIMPLDDDTIPAGMIRQIREMLIK